jgi:hypothetical protein
MILCKIFGHKWKYYLQRYPLFRSCKVCFKVQHADLYISSLDDRWVDDGPMWRGLPGQDKHKEELEAIEARRYVVLEKLKEAKPNNETGDGDPNTSS